MATDLPSKTGMSCEYLYVSHSLGRGVRNRSQDPSPVACTSSRGCRPPAAPQSVWSNVRATAKASCQRAGCPAVARVPMRPTEVDALPIAIRRAAHNSCLRQVPTKPANGPPPPGPATNGRDITTLGRRRARSTILSAYTRPRGASAASAVCRDLLAQVPRMGHDASDHLAQACAQGNPGAA